ncbi:hypothetical protein BBP40_002089 [Aspergillus hancockii]|nr:hypothetical protein BBP40_002089 [Aspergillus hancockii]
MSGPDAPVDGVPIGVSYLAGFIFLSYVVSMMGCTTTLELLHRRTARAGLYNWYLLLTSSIAMGGVGIWCMHFIGNRAIVLGNGVSDIQIVYSMTFTGVSFVLPVVVLLAAFYAIGASEKAGYIRIMTGGVLTGSSVCVAGGSRRKLRAQAQQLVLSCAFFDPEGRIMVTPHALLPSRKIVDRYLGRTFNDDDLTRTHPAFLWAVRASRNWKLVTDVVPLMRGKIESDEAMKEQYASKGVVSDQEAELKPHFDDLFKRHFCVTAQDLAEEVRQPLQDMGMLYDHVLATSAPSSHFSRAMGYDRIRAGKGQLLFTVRQLKKQEASRMAAAGFRFTTIENVTSILSRRIHVPTTALGTHLKDMRDYAASNRIFEPGVHLISFIMRPTVHDHFEVLTAKGVGNPLPSSTLSTKRLQIQHLEMIAHMEGWTISTCLNWLQSKSAQAYKDVDEFRGQLIDAITALSSSLPPDVNLASKFSARPLIAPCRINRISDGENCVLLPFCVVGSLDTQISNPDYTFTPLRLFRVQQQTNDGIGDIDGFAKDLSQELLYSKIRPTSSTDSDLADSMRSKLRFWSPRKQPDSTIRTASQESLSEHTLAPEIMVRREVKVDVAKLAEPTFEPSLGRHASETTVVAGDMASSTYVDELYNLCYSPGVRLRPDPGFHRMSTIR